MNLDLPRHLPKPSYNPWMPSLFLRTVPAELFRNADRKRKHFPQVAVSLLSGAYRGDQMQSFTQQCSGGFWEAPIGAGESKEKDKAYV